MIMEQYRAQMLHAISWVMITAKVARIGEKQKHMWDIEGGRRYARKASLTTNT